MVSITAGIVSIKAAAELSRALSLEDVAGGLLGGFVGGLILFGGFALFAVLH